MNATGRWRTVALVSAALFAGSIIGPPLVQAATASLVTIQGSGSTRKAGVTKAGQLQAAEADPGSVVMAFSGATCNAGGFYTIPVGKALIITGVNIYNHPASPGSVELDLTAGPAASPCGNIITAGISDGDLTLNQAFHPGIPVPAGDSLGGLAFNENGSVQVYGYLVPATDVAAAALRQLPPARAGHGTMVRHSR
jgi:hypothetical protein